jgi:hypothetical protein
VGVFSLTPLKKTILIKTGKKKGGGEGEGNRASVVNSKRFLFYFHILVVKLCGKAELAFFGWLVGWFAGCALTTAVQSCAGAMRF